MLSCERCGDMNTTVTTVHLEIHHRATVGDLCNSCKYDLNRAVLVPELERSSKRLYTHAREWIKENKKSEYTLAT